MKHPQEKLGEIFVLMSAIFQGIFPVGAHFGATQLPQIQFLAYVTLASTLLYWPISLYKKEAKKLWNKKVLRQLLIYTVFGNTLPYAIIVFATKFSSAIETTLLMQSEVIFAMVCGFFFLNEKLSKNKVLGATLMLVANLILLVQNNLTFNWANVAIFLAPLCFVFGNSIAKKLQSQGISGTLILSFRTALGGSILLILASELEGLQMPNPSMIGFIVAFAFTVFGLGKILWQMGLHRLDLSKVTSLGLSAPALSILFAFILLAEIPSSTQWISIGVAALGIVFLLKTHSRQWAEQAALD